jgi:pyroglutamyl-peptidase
MPVKSADTRRARPSTLPRVLVTGFEAFGDDPSGLGLNPSALAAHALHGKRIAGHRLVAAVLPCVYGQSISVLKALIKQHQPTLIICVGQAGGRAGLSIERVAVNLDDAPYPDNAGCVRLACPVLPGTPTAYFSTLPLQTMLATLQRQGIASELSSSAGHFVCNHVFYALMHLLATRRGLGKVRGGFIHVPYLPEQAAATGVASMLQETINHGLSQALRAALARRSDASQHTTA